MRVLTQLRYLRIPPVVDSRGIRERRVTVVSLQVAR